MKKTLIADFFTTVSFSQYVDSIKSITYRLNSLKKWKEIKIIENKLLHYLWLHESKIISFYNWRSALFHSLKMIWIKAGDEIIVSWYTCVTVSNTVIQSGWKIVYCDIEKKSLGLSADDLINKITNKTKVIIIQHTFWKPSNISKIIKIAQEKNILIIEDCAHSLWSEIKWKRLWSFWDFSIFSTWRDKVISSVTGWFLVINNSNYFKSKKKVENKLSLPSINLILKNHNYNIFWYEAYKLYDFLKIWRIEIFLLRKLWLITEILTKSEKKCKYKDFNYKLPNSLAYLAINQFKQLWKTIKHNIKLASYYNEWIKNKKISILFKTKTSEINNYFRYPILLKNSKETVLFYKYMRKNNILVWKSWSWINIAPLWTNLNNAKYKKWNCKISENISERILFLPNHKNIKKREVEYIIEKINNY